MKPLRVCVFGPESTGKSTLAERLAQHFDTVHVPEYARLYAEEHGADLGPEDTQPIGEGQIALEDECAAQAKRLLILDTDILSTCIWSQALYNRVPPAVTAWAETRTCDLYLLLDVDVPWVEDPQRVWPGTREEFFESCKLALEQRSLPFVVIRGDWTERFAAACEAIEHLLKERGA